MGKQGQRITEEAGVIAKPKPPKPPKPKRAYTQRRRGEPKPYTGPTWIGKAITK